LISMLFHFLLLLISILFHFHFLLMSILGYCQSMNIVVASLLMFADEEESFYLLCAIVRKVPEYYEANMIGTRCDGWGMRLLCLLVVCLLFVIFRPMSLDLARSDTQASSQTQTSSQRSFRRVCPTSTHTSNASASTSPSSVWLASLMGCDSFISFIEPLFFL
jgi:hypothetical protein